MSDDIPPGWLPLFAVFWGGQACSLLGSAIVQFALIWWLTDLTGSPAVLAAAGMAGTIPAIVLSPFVGPLIDRWDRRTIMIVADVGIALTSAALALLYGQGLVRVEYVYMALFFRSVGDAFHSPTAVASTSTLVPAQQLTRVAGMNALLDGAVRLGAPPLGALLLRIAPLDTILLIDVATAALAVAALAGIRIPRQEWGGRIAGLRGVWRDLCEGYRYIVNSPGLTFLLLTTAAAQLLKAPAYYYLPLFVIDYLRGGADLLGWLQSAQGLGALAGGGLLGAWGGFRRRMATVVVGQFVAGAFLVVLSSGYGLPWVPLLAATCMGVAGSVYWGAKRAVLQSVVPKEMQGRVFALNNSLSRAMTPLALALSAPVAAVTGVQASLFLGGAGGMVLALAWLLIPHVYRLEDVRVQHGILHG